jgi:hypothetical protein
LALPIELTQQEERLNDVLPQNVPPLPPLPTQQLVRPTTIAHQTEWWDDPEATLIDMGGSVPQRDWSIRTVIGRVTGTG